MFLRLICLLFIFLISTSCSKDEPAYVASEEENPFELYEEGLKGFENNNFFFASKKFDQAELNFTIVENAAKANVMSTFSLYSINFYNEALENISRFLKNYPSDTNIIYMQYLKALIYYEQIIDEKKDLEPLIKADRQIDIFVKEYPNTDYAQDLIFKKALIKNQMAAKELFVAKFYISTQKWIPAINRLKKIVTEYDQTIFIEEALHRLVEIYYLLGFKEEAQKYAAILGYNYNSSKWFERSYVILNKDYKIKKFSSAKKENSFIKKIIEKIK